MDVDILLTKCLTLLCREAEVDSSVSGSEDLIKTTLSKVKIDEVDIGLPSKRDLTQKLKKLVLDTCDREKGKEVDKTEILQHVKIITADNTSVYEAVKIGIEPELAPAVLKRTITNLRKSVEDYFREQKTVELATKVYRDLNFGRHNISDLSEYLRNTVMELEVLSRKATSKNVGIVKSMNFEEDEEMSAVFSSSKERAAGGSVFVTPFRELNEALQGGPRPGDAFEIGAKHHGYKSGMCLSLFTFIPIFNKPKTNIEGKKPLLYSVSFEDPLENNAQFMYTLLKYDETREKVDITGVSVEEMWKYVQARMRATGYHVIMEEANPNDWTHRDLINRLIELEAEGYTVEVLRTDYLSKMKEPALRTGSIGDDVMEQLSRVRAFCSANGILLLNVRQVSTEGIREESTNPGPAFLNRLKGQSFYEGSKGIGRIQDINMLIHRIEQDNGPTWLHCIVDKHRFPTAVDSKLKEWFLKMPENMMPIPSNLMDEDYKVHRRMPRTMSSADDAFFA